MFRKSIIVFLILIFLLAGCTRYDDELIGSENNPPINPFVVKIRERINLYYPDKDMTTLEKESRVVQATMNTLNNIIMEELINGTRSSSRVNILPEDTKLLSLEVVDRIAYVSFSKELLDKNYTEQEEAFILYSIVNTLTEREDINRVQILIEGEIKDTLYKRYTTLHPKAYSPIIVDEPYQSPVYVIVEYYEALISKDYENIVLLFSADKRDVLRSFFISYYQELLGNMYSYKINSYSFSGYDESMIVTINTTIYYDEDKIKENQTQRFELVYERGQYRIENIRKK